MERGDDSDEDDALASNLVCVSYPHLGHAPQAIGRYTVGVWAWELFLFPSRRRHTSLTCDWSSHVCSSDLHARTSGGASIAGGGNSAATTPDQTTFCSTVASITHACRNASSNTFSFTRCCTSSIPRAAPAARWFPTRANSAPKKSASPNSSAPAASSTVYPEPVEARLDAALASRKDEGPKLSGRLC